VSPVEPSPVPEIPETLAGLSQAVQQHYADHPAHSSGCTCLDPVIRAIARKLLPHGGENCGCQVAGVSDRTREALAHVLTEIARRL
jgi:hypothetical protein